MKKNKEMQLVEISKAQKFETNPFVEDLGDKLFLRPRADMILSKNQKIVTANPETGEQITLHDQVIVGRRRFVDKSQFFKIYASSVGILFDLNKPAQNVFIYLCKQMTFKENLAIFNFNTEYKKLGYKTKYPALMGIRELLTKNIIAMREAYIWWINPLVAHKGDRFAMYTEYISTDNKDLLAQDLMNFKRNKKLKSMPEIPQLEAAKQQPSTTRDNKTITQDDFDLFSN